MEGVFLLKKKGVDQMTYTDANLLHDRNGNPIPQLYDPETESFKPATVVQKVSDSDILAELKTLNADNFKSLEVLDQVAETAKASLDNVNAAIASGTDDLEIKEARRGFPTLGEKIDDVTIYKGETVPGYLPTGALWLDTSDESFQGTVFEEFDGKLTQHDADLEKVNEELASNLMQVEVAQNKATYAESFNIQSPEVDDSGRLQRAIQHAEANGGILILAPKRYKISSTLRIKQGIKMFSEHNKGDTGLDNSMARKYPTGEPETHWKFMPILDLFTD